MLVLSRKVGERMLIGDEIVLTVLDMSGRRIRLGIEAPADVAIQREEIASSWTADLETSTLLMTAKPR
jgi:carbon storage regulator